MKVTIPNISTNYLEEYTLTKEVDNNFIVEKLEASPQYQDADHKYLYERAIYGEDKTGGTIEKECGGSTFTKNVHIKHNEGEFDVLQCITTKELSLDNTLDCIVNKTINIFDYARTETNTIQGDSVERETVSFNIDFYFDTDNYSLDDVLNQIGIEDRAYEGFYIESGKIDVNVRILETQFEDEYETHEIVGYVNYIRIKSSTKISDKWILIPGDTDYYYSGVVNALFSLLSVETISLITDQDIHYAKHYFAGKENLYQKVDISNTIAINQILIDIFTCTGKTLISNFLGINSDATAPNNDKYIWATNYATNIKIAQSYDIIKEDAEQDSFSQSGDIKVKSLLLNLFKAYGLRLTTDGANIRLEHLSYFTNKGIDITAQSYELTPLKINKDAINSETFSFARETPTPNFYQTKIEYDINNIYAEENNININCNLMLTDIFGTLNNPLYLEGGYEDFFFLLCTDGTSIIELNEPFSMLELVKNLHDIHRPMKTGIINGEQFLFGSNSIGFSGEIILQSNLLQWDLLTPLMSVETNEGFFLIDSIEINESDTLTLKIKK